MIIFFKLAFVSLSLVLSSHTYAKKNYQINDLIYAFQSRPKNGSSQSNATFQVYISKNALDQVFLMQTALISGPPTPTGNALANKLVYFKKQGHSLFLFESHIGKIATNSIKSKTLLAQFDILTDNGQSFHIDFKKGMKNLFAKGNYYVKEYNQKEQSIEVVSSYIENVQSKNDFIFINQIVQTANIDKEGTRSLSSSQLKYVFSKYNKNKSFSSTETLGFETVGYFENHPIYPVDEKGNIIEKPTVHIKKFDHKKGITFHISNEIPKKFKQAVIDGVLYWNKAFGKKILTVKELPENVTVHTPGYNIIKWLKWDSAGFAYADAQSDPLTGENLQAHVYMTSVFGVSGLKRAKKLYKKLKEAKDKKAYAHNHFKVSEKYSTALCSHSESKINLLENIISGIDATNVTDKEKEKIFERFASDYIRYVIAHEVGHTLGLRHNFTGSLSTTMKIDNFDKVTEQYLLTGKVPKGFLPSSTVMDYLTPYFSSMGGAMIRLGHDVLPYDKIAIETGYYSLQNQSYGTFCTDNLANSKFQDCKRFDRFENVISGAFKNLALKINNASYNLYQDIFKNILENKEDNTTTKIKKIKKITHKKIDDLATSIVSNEIVNIFKMAKSDSSFIALKRKLKDETPEIFSEELFFFKKQSFDKNGGLEKIFIDLTPKSYEDLFLTEISIHILRDLQSYLITEKNDPEINIALTEKLIKLIVRFDKKLSSFALDKITDLLKKSVDNSSNVLFYKNRDFERSLFYFALSFIERASSMPYIELEEISILKPYYKRQVRSKAVELLNLNIFPGLASYKRNLELLKTPVKNSYKKFEESLLKMYSKNKMSDELYDFYMIEKEIFSRL